jgi:3D-(3,5/4)-trihydroxycyclohexane-1,2-dione acylhydrolase (decyclizing)
MDSVQLTVAQALVRFLIAQRSEIDGGEVPLFAGVFAIFGHGNVTCLGEALQAVQDQLPTWRGSNEQAMALTATAFARAKRRRQIMVATSSIGPGATNMVTAAAVAHSNRLPVLLLPGDTYASRLPDPVLQQVEPFHDLSVTVNDCFKPVSRFWDRITRPEQILYSLPQAIATMLDPADCGPAVISLSQDVQGEAYTYPLSFFRQRVHHITRPRPDAKQIAAAAAVLGSAQRPLIVAGGGVHYSLATQTLTDFAERHHIPVVETIMGRSTMTWDHPLNAGHPGVMGGDAANAMAADTDVVLAVGTRLADFATGSWSVFKNPDLKLVHINAARFDANKHLAYPVVGDARVALEELSHALANWRAPEAWAKKAQRETARWNQIVSDVMKPSNVPTPTYAQVIGSVQRKAHPSDIAVSAAGGLPGELLRLWRSRQVGTFECEWGYSCMGYEIAGALGMKMARPEREVIVFVGDGGYLMMNSDIYSSVITDHKLIIVVCDNGGFASINRLQTSQGVPEFNNLFKSSRVKRMVDIDFAAHARAMGAVTESVTSVSELEQALDRARDADRTYVIAIRVDQYQFSPGGSWWDIGTPEVSAREQVLAAAAQQRAGGADRRRGV